MPGLKCHVFVCTNRRAEGAPRGSCAARGSEAVLEQLKAESKRQGVGRDVRIQKAGCLDICEHGPAAVVYPEGTWYGGLSPEDAEGFVRQQVVQSQKFSQRLIRTES